MNSINSKKEVREISTLQSSTLNTNLPPQDLIRILHKHVEFSFKS